MKFKNLFFIFLVLFFISITCVSASELNSTFDESDFEFESEYENLKLGSKKNNIIGNQYSLNGTRFSDIQNVIVNASHGDTIILNGNFHAENDSSTIVIDKKLNIYSTDGAVLDARGLSGIFRLNEGSAGSVISGLTFINGKQGSGSAVYVLSKNNTFDNCVFQNNHGNENSGGAFATTYDAYATEGLTISNCLFKGNSAPVSSGAVAIFGTNFTVINTTFENNFASNNMWRAACEGALQVGMAGTNGIVYNCTFKNNYVRSNDMLNPSRGGAMGLRKGTVVENCKFINNDAEYGGAIVYLTGGELINCSFIANSADCGGAIASVNSDIDIVNIVNSSFTFNKAINGGLLYFNSNQLNIWGSVFRDNVAQQYGGAVVFGEYGQLSKVINIYNSNFTNNDAITGGALCLYSRENNVYDSFFMDNVARHYGGAIYNHGLLKVSTCHFLNNFVYYIGVKLDCDKNYVNWSDEARIKLSFHCGNNVIDDIWSNNLPVTIDNTIFVLDNRIGFQDMMFKISDDVFTAKTDVYGLPTIQFNTSKYVPMVYECVASIQLDDKLSISKNFDLHITDKIEYVPISINNIKQVKNETHYESYLPTMNRITVEYIRFYYIYVVDHWKRINKDLNSMTINNFTYSWNETSKADVDGIYKWYPARYYTIYTYNVTNITHKYVNGKFDSEHVESYIFTNQTDYEDYRTEDFSRYLLPSVDCESDDETIRNLARSIIESATNAGQSVDDLTDEQKATAILFWVQYYVDYDWYGETRRGALKTLHDMEGNCVDQTHLTVALLRAANIPARYHAKYNGGEAGHCWPEVYFNNTWHIGESTLYQEVCPYDTNDVLQRYIDNPAKTGCDKISHQYNSKYIYVDGVNVAIVESYAIAKDLLVPNYVLDFFEEWSIIIESSIIDVKRMRWG